MKRSRAVNLILLASAAAALEGCGNRQCVDEHNIVVDDRNCQTSSTGYTGYHYYHVGGGGFVPVGSSVDAAGTSRGVFGAAGEGASHGSGGGAGAGE